MCIMVCACLCSRMCMRGHMHEHDLKKLSQVNTQVEYIGYWMHLDRYKYVPVSILCKSIAGRYRPVRVADGPITARCGFIKNASWGVSL